ncbi:MAG: hypothetical protein COV70_00870 [Parcubacteria group bacterium CG11_big_fil_rev_8_21_14_0_20_39_22]|nr:MAG: hypothetical protein COV70_00870 [Parcubacteria group bacterium CG11_big_fil_rev_8_21_14_0_20_39_22]
MENFPRGEKYRKLDKYNELAEKMRDAVENPEKYPEVLDTPGKPKRGNNWLRKWEEEKEQREDEIAKVRNYRSR